MQGVPVQSWVGELRSHVPHSQKKKQQQKIWDKDKEHVDTLAWRKMSVILAFVNAGYSCSLRLVTWRVRSESNGARSFIHAAVAKSLQSCPTLCDPIDGSPPGSPIPGILQARTVEWVAISFSNAWKWKVKVKLCLTLSDPMDCSPPGSSIHGIFHRGVFIQDLGHR